MTTLSLSLLGPFQASLGDESLTDFRTRKMQALLIYLAVEPEAHRRDRLLHLLWPGLPEKSARSNLRQILYYLRQTIPELSGPSTHAVPAVIANRQEIRLNAKADVSVDTCEFERLLGKVQAHEHLDVFLCAACAERLEAAVSLYRGDFLADFYLDDSNEFEEWAQARREYFRRKALDALGILATMALRRRDYAAAETWAHRQLEIDNLRESAYRQRMKALALSGRREQALAAYETCRRVLTEELGMAPAARTTEYSEKILAGDLRFDRSPFQGVRGYQLKEPIGEGDYGAIYRAVQPAVLREVAVKVIRRRFADDPEFIRRFEAEAQTVARLEHPYIVPLYDYWRDPAGAFLVMRYMRGGNLLEALEAGPWDVERTAAMLEQIAGALASAHRQGVVHRDIKPGNILLDEVGNAYLADFGIAKNLAGERQLRAEGTVVGSLDYISPEQITGDVVTAQTDIYSLGAVVYETLTGEKPFDGGSPARLLYSHLHEAMPLVTATRPDVAPEVDTVLQRATVKTPAKRYATVQEMAAAFRTAVRGREPEAEGSGRERLPALAEVYNPYKGLQAFQEADADNFFGREALVEQLINRLGVTGKGQENRFLAVVGPSGSGKSSVVKAGLVPALREGALPGSDKWFITEMVPGINPLAELELALWRVAVDSPPNLVEPMRRDAGGILRTVRRILPGGAALQQGRPQLLLIIDQFEELFTLVEEEAERAFFLDSLLAAIEAPRSPLRVVVTLRADFYDRPLQYSEWGQLLKEHTEIVLPLNRAELTYAVREPARRMGVRLEAGLVATIVASVVDQPGALPLLQYMMTELFDLREGSRITGAVYEQLGGVQGALGRRAEATYAALDDREQQATRQLLLRLITLGEGVEDTRRRVLRSELEALATAEAATEPVDGDVTVVPVRETPVACVLERFAAARFLTFDRDPVTRAPTVEVAHESLLHEWPRLRRWLAESRDDLRLQRFLSSGAADWFNSGKDPSFLLRGTRLRQFEEWVGGATLALTADERAFLDASVEARRSREAEAIARQMARERRRRRSIMALIAGLIITIGMAAFAFYQRQDAFAQRLAAQRQAAILLASQAESELAAGFHDRAVLLALEALEKFPYTAQAERALGQAVLYNRARQQYLGHNTAVTSLAWSPDGSKIASSAGTDNAVHIWDPLTGETLLVIDLPTGISGNLLDMGLNVLWAPDGERLLVLAGDRYRLGSQDFDLLLYEAETGVLLSSVEIPNGVKPASGETLASFVSYPTGSAADVAPGNGRLATLGGDNTALIWNAEWQEPEIILRGHRDAVNSVAWSPDGKELVTTGMDGTSRVWDGRSSEERLRLQGHDGRVSVALWSPDGELIATAGEDGTVRLWDAGDGHPVRQLDPATESVWSLAWSHDGSYLVTGHHDGQLAIWEAGTGKLMTTLAGHQGFVSDLAWSPVDDRLVSGDSSGAARIWNAAPTTAWRTFPVSYAQGIDWSSDSRFLAVSGGDVLGDAEPPSLAIWEVEADRVAAEGLAAELNYNGVYVYFSPDDQRILWAGYRGFPDFYGGDSIYALDPWSGKFLRTFTAEEGNVIRTFNWSPDGTQVATGMFNGPEIWIWDFQSGQKIKKLSAGPAGNIFQSVTWSPDGSKFAAAETNSTAPVWDAESWELLYTITGHEPPTEVWSVDWSPDGRKLLTTAGSEELGAGDNTVRIWDGNTGEEVLVLRGHTKSVQFGYWSPDGHRILTASVDNTVRIWDAATGDELLRLAPPPAIFGISTSWSPDGRYLATSGLGTPTSVWRVWQSREELLAYAQECCVFRELMPYEREQFGLTADDG